MKSLQLSIIVLLFFIVSSCRKEENENAMDFKITGVHNIELKVGEQTSPTLKVFYLGGKREKVRLTAFGMPAGVSISFEGDNQEPDYSLTENLVVSSSADTGTFTITVEGKSESDKTFRKEFLLKIKPIGDAAPSIIINGGTGIQHSLNAPWFDPGVTATDPEDGDLTSQVTVSGSVNVDQAGTYLIEYTVTDSGGNTTTVVRTVQVLNDVNFISGNYTCLTISPDSTYNWITTISASTTENNRFVIFKIGDLFRANPILTYNPLNDSISMATQSHIGVSPVDSTLHTFNGKGTVMQSGTHLSIRLDYIDNYFDTTGTLQTKQKTDFYNN